ncbi:hypothetical protein DFS33DRAFT_863490 [Desarmillaria ectypa]|nr:hypothetical protein DFS33DRAFT_863490 [Desarmillaria ectypa]
MLGDILVYDPGQCVDRRQSAMKTLAKTNTVTKTEAWNNRNLTSIRRTHSASDSPCLQSIYSLSDKVMSPLTFAWMAISTSRLRSRRSFKAAGGATAWRSERPTICPPRMEEDWYRPRPSPRIRMGARATCHQTRVPHPVLIDPRGRNAPEEKTSCQVWDT